jgi:hypothetical protein
LKGCIALCWLVWRSFAAAGLGHGRQRACTCLCDRVVDELCLAGVLQASSCGSRAVMRWELRSRCGSGVDVVQCLCMRGDVLGVGGCWRPPTSANSPRAPGLGV